MFNQAPQTAPAGAPPPAPGPAAAPPPAAGAPQQLDQSMLQRVVMAGQKLMYDPKTRQVFINGLKQKGDPTQTLPADIVGLMKMLDEKQKQIQQQAGKPPNGLPRQIIPSAAVALMVEAAHFAAEGGIFVLSKDQLAAAGKNVIQLCLKVFGGAPAGSTAAPPAAAQASGPPGQASAPANPAPPPGLINRAQGGA